MSERPLIHLVDDDDSFRSALLRLLLEEVQAKMQQAAAGHAK